jgi:hypothetical protein
MTNVLYGGGVRTGLYPSNPSVAMTGMSGAASFGPYTRSALEILLIQGKLCEEVSPQVKALSMQFGTWSREGASFAGIAKSTKRETGRRTSRFVPQ